MDGKERGVAGGSCPVILNYIRSAPTTSPQLSPKLYLRVCSQGSDVRKALDLFLFLSVHHKDTILYKFSFNNHNLLRSVFTKRWSVFLFTISLSPTGEACWSRPVTPRSRHLRDRGSTGGSVSEAEVLVLGKLCCGGRSSGHQSCWGLGCSRGFRGRVRHPGWWGLPTGRSVHSRRGVLAALRSPGL